ncbi:2695_t:CDS:2, partial [Dentiscutata erythropus]
TVIEELIDQGLTKKEANLALDAAIHVLWNGFHEIEKRKEKTETQKNSHQKSRKPSNPKEAILQKVKDRKKITNRRIDAL